MADGVFACADVYGQCVERGIDLKRRAALLRRPDLGAGRQVPRDPPLHRGPRLALCPRWLYVAMTGDDPEKR
jgi:hypothetical protein